MAAAARNDSGLVAAASNAWPRDELIEELLGSLAVAAELLSLGCDGEGFARIDPAVGAPKILFEKAVSEAAMLLLFVDPIRPLDIRLGKRFSEVLELLIPYARSETVLAAICVEPGRAREYALAHAALSRLGHRDHAVDAVLIESLRDGDGAGPERLPYRRLEQEWLVRLWPAGNESIDSERGLLRTSSLGRPLDALTSSRGDIYAFTHAVMYATDLGLRSPKLPRSASAITADADAALAYSLLEGDHDLTVELALTWPLLGRSWSTIANFAFHVATRTKAALGFLPGLGFEQNRYALLRGSRRRLYAIGSSYHTVFALGFLCAAALRSHRLPSRDFFETDNVRPCGAGSALLQMVELAAIDTVLAHEVTMLDDRSRDALAPLLLAATLRMAVRRGDLELLRDALRLALAHELLDAPAPRQALALLRRSSALDRSLKAP